MARLAAVRAGELDRLRRLQESLAKTRASDWRRVEEDAIKRATLAARAARYQRKVITARTRSVLEDLARQTLSLRLARANTHAVSAEATVKAVAKAERDAARDLLRMAAEERTGGMAALQGSLASQVQALQTIAAAAREETARQLEQRKAAAHAQRDALTKAFRDLQVDEAELVDVVKREQRQAEEAFLVDTQGKMMPALVAVASRSPARSGSGVMSSSSIAGSGDDSGKPSVLAPVISRLNQTGRRMASLINKRVVESERHSQDIAQLIAEDTTVVDAAELCCGDRDQENDAFL
jgi:hypothetical protein